MRDGRKPLMRRPATAGLAGTVLAGSVLAGMVLAVTVLAVTVLAACAGRAAPPGIGVQRSGPAASTRSPATGSPGTGSPVQAVPRPGHIVVVVFENHPYASIVGNPQAPFLNRLARRGALLTASYAVTHPSEPNYLALFSGSTQGVTSDQCPTWLHAPNLAADLIAAGLSFGGYSEGLPAPGSPACSAGEYARKHAPWTDFAGLPRSVNQPFHRFAATSYASLPTVSFVIPDLCHDMHDCSVGTGDAWLRAHLAGYAAWAMTHDSLLIVTWDEDDGGHNNHIVTILVGQQVRPGRYGTPVNHYNVLRTIEQAYRLPYRGRAATHYPITAIWRRPG